MLFGSKTQQRCPQERRSAEIEWPVRLFSRYALRATHLVGWRKITQVDYGQRHVHARLDQLAGLTVPNFEARSKHLMAANDFVDGILEGVRIDGGSQPNRRWHVVDRRSGLELLQ
jgi:hypothetical protein